MNKLACIVFICAAALLNGCVSHWTLSRGGSLSNQSRYGITVTIPANWYKRTLRNATIMTRNGISLESILLYKKKWTDTLSNRHRIPKNILLHQLPELLLGEFSANGNAFNMTTLDNRIVSIDSLPCSRAYYRYTAPNSLNMRGTIYCIPFKSYITILCFEAEESHYYRKSFNDFTEMASSITIKKKRYRALPGIVDN